jgi:polysaccharide biosynthesis/export protein
LLKLMLPRRHRRWALAATALLTLLQGCAENASFDTLGAAILSDGPILGSEAGAPPEAAVYQASQTTFGEPPTAPAGFGGPPQAVADTDGPYLLDTGDRLRVFVYGQPNLSRGYTVDHDGTITVPLIGSVTARGKTVKDLAASIRSKLGTEFVRDPQVTVDIQQNRPFFILGEVKTAGQYPYVSGMTIETAIAIAGGHSDRASMRSYRLTRRVNGFVEVIEAPGDYVMQAGDTVFVHERFL